MDAVELVPTSSVGPLDASDGSRPGPYGATTSLHRPVGASVVTTYIMDQQSWDTPRPIGSPARHFLWSSRGLSGMNPIYIWAPAGDGKLERWCNHFSSISVLFSHSSLIPLENHRY